MGKTLNKIVGVNPPVLAPEKGQQQVFCVYIDGSNLFHRICKCEIFEEDFDYRGFVNWLCGCEAENVRYYVGQARRDKDEKSKKIYASQQRRFERLKKMGLYILRGHIMKVGDKFIEKGVDVRMGVDLVVGALTDKYDTAILISSDGDLGPAVEHAVKAGKKIIYVGIKESRISFHLKQLATTTKLIGKKEMKQFVIDKK